MLIDKVQRGRPKGSGIDDSAVLLEIAARLAADPNLRPTTAIKAAGIADPSVIRRLRDKLRQGEGRQDMASTPDCGKRDVKSAAKASSAATANAIKANSVMACANENAAEMKSAPMASRSAGRAEAAMRPQKDAPATRPDRALATRPAETTDAKAPGRSGSQARAEREATSGGATRVAPARREPLIPQSTERLLVAWMGAGVAAFNAALQAQQIAAGELMKLPAVALLMRQQVALSEMALALCTPKRHARFSLH